VLGIDVGPLNPLLLVIGVVLFAIKVFAVFDCVARAPGEFLQHGNVPKAGWLTILVLAVLAHAYVDSFNPLGLFSLIGTVAALVYLAQLRGSDH
jgi:hypothetical protein